MMLIPKPIHASLIVLVSLILFGCRNEIPKKKIKISSKTIKIIDPLKNYTSFYTLDTIPQSIVKELKDKATSDELNSIIDNYKNPYLKAVAIDAMIAVNRENAFELFEKLSYSKDNIVFRTECLRDTILIPTYIFNTIVFSDQNKSTKEKEIDKALFFKILFNQDKLNENLVDEMHYWLPNSEEYYKRIREIIIKNKSKKLLRALSMFQNKKDIPLIKSFGKDSFIAIANFKDDAFLEMFEKYISFNNNWDYKFALNQYPKNKTEIIYLKIKKYNKNNTH